MKYFELIEKQYIDKTIDEVFNFFSKPENLEVITPKYLKFSIKTPLPITMEEGQVIEYKIRLRGIPMKWKSRISSYNPPHSFIDEQIKGPYSYWHHTHIFKVNGNGTDIIDHVKYNLPFGLIGVFANYFFVNKDLKKIFKYRKSTINEIFSDKI